MPLLAFYRAGREEGGFELGIQRGLMATLASTKFLYRTERHASGAAPGEAHPIDDIELAPSVATVWSFSTDVPETPMAPMLVPSASLRTTPAASRLA